MSRIHVTLDDQLLAAIDARVGPRGRSAFLAQAARLTLEREHRMELLRAAAGSISDTGHEWDDDPAAWVHAQRFSEGNRFG